MTSDGQGINIAVLVSGQGRGTNLQAIMDACANGRIDGRVAVVIGVKDDAPAMQRARDQQVEAVAASPKDYSPEDYDAVLLSVLRDFKVDLVCLAGYMRKIGQPIIDAYRNRIMNVHPALIPMFFGQGMFGHHVHEAAIERGVRVSGATVHFVDEDYDTGPIIIQKFVTVMFDDTPDTLAARILPEEHRAYVEAIQLFARGRLRVEGRKVRILE
ncbi:MAG: phosphoribosylglycinamide formyltransferase [Armatimonadota bacterium]|nr:phosphoribosylglycinamide formyltransferase [Armatimonadota bacterium]